MHHICSRLCTGWRPNTWRGGERGPVKPVPRVPGSWFLVTPSRKTLKANSSSSELASSSSGFRATTTDSIHRSVCARSEFCHFMARSLSLWQPNVELSKWNEEQWTEREKVSKEVNNRSYLNSNSSAFIVILESCYEIIPCSVNEQRVTYSKCSKKENWRLE